jgi:hypothetical protein
MTLSRKKNPIRIPHNPTAAAQTDEFGIIIGRGCILKGKLQRSFFAYTSAVK